jgi:hypothetical protein
MKDTPIPSPVCSKCNSPMSPGLMKDSIEPPERERVVVFPEWLEGLPAKPGALAEFAYGIGTIDYSKAKRRVVVTYCCNQCGYLESYALPHGLPYQAAFRKV